MSPILVKKIKQELHGYDVSGATIHFTHQNQLPKSLLQNILKARLKEITKL